MATVRRWGNSLAVRIPAGLAEQLQLKSGTPIEMVPVKGALVMKPKKRVRYRLQDLLKNCKPSQLHGEVDFGADLGREILD
jgi:antitoxin MazE